MKSDSSDGFWYFLGTVGLLGGLVLIRRYDAHGYRRPVREGIIGGALAGAGLALLARREAPKKPAAV